MGCLTSEWWPAQSCCPTEPASTNLARFQLRRPRFQGQAARPTSPRSLVRPMICQTVAETQLFGVYLRHLAKDRALTTLLLIRKYRSHALRTCVRHHCCARILIHLELEQLFAAFPSPRPRTSASHCLACSKLLHGEQASILVSSDRTSSDLRRLASSPDDNVIQTVHAIPGKILTPTIVPLARIPGQPRQLSRCLSQFLQRRHTTVVPSLQKLHQILA